MITTRPINQIPKLNNSAITEADIITYTFGHCAFFAIALNLLFKYPIYAMSREFALKLVNGKPIE